ncbi:MAG: homocysteine S-methyltransferase family protein [Dissulfurispiraceae bacterium]|jgi:5-methyltetrahydrofolate--homocysteine methyltransferase|nr:homocysteine S-methyltransferase family protein [Dissulfurispiraceae bacterium]
MAKDAFRNAVSQKVLVLDGATGTELARNGMPAGVSPEAWVMENPHVIQKIQQAYIAAGSDAVYTCTFGGNRLKLREFGLEDRTAEINTSLARASREAVGSSAFVFGDMAPTGLFVEPFGELPFEEAVKVYAEQVRALIEGGVDGFVIETMMDLQEARAALIAVKETCDLPVMVSMTFGTDGRTLNGTDPLSALITLQSLGADAVGCNCSTGPQDMAKVIAAMKPFAMIPLLAKPNAGMPHLVNGVTTFDMSPEKFGEHVPLLVEAGAAIIGGCCGTDPSYIREIRNSTASIGVLAPNIQHTSAVCSYRETILVGNNVPLTVFSGRINPSKSSALAAGLAKGDMALLRKMVQEQASLGAAVININVHAEGVDEAAAMRAAVLVAAKTCSKSVAINTTNFEAARQALRVFPGRAILNNVGAKDDQMEEMCYIASSYGAMIVCMPADETGVLGSTADAIARIQKIQSCASKYSIARKDCLVDCLVSTIAAGSVEHKRTFELISWCAQSGYFALLSGISDLSHGLETRKWINGTFLCMAAGHGLTAAFIDMSDEYMVNTAYAVDALISRDARMSRYIARFGKQSGNEETSKKQKLRTPIELVFDAVVTGDEEGIEQVIRNALDKGESAKTLVDDSLIPAINLVGDKFDRKEYFLPQLITCADTMRKGFTVLQPILDATGGATGRKGPKVVLATVQGDIHDIGKNIVALMLKNYNFDVIDLGKDVGAEDIIRAVKHHGADIIGLSALMTTTMVEMKKVINLARAAGLTQVRFMIGGAVIDQKYADEIGANGYASDAIGAVRLAQKFSC